MATSRNLGASNTSIASLQKNYYFKDDLAYTEDHILIKRLYMYNVAKELNAQRLLKYFKSFGAVLQLRLNPVPMNCYNKTKTGFILFKNPRSAAKVLRRNIHIIGVRRLNVKPNYSWHQPSAYGDSKRINQMAPIFKMNDHCLEHIVRLLSLDDRIHFGRICIRFRNVYLQLAPCLDKSVNMEIFKEMTVWDMRDFFKLSGRFIKNIRGIMPEEHCQHLCEFIGANCNNLISLDLQVNKLTLSNMNNLFTNNLQQLEQLKLSNCQLENNTLPPLAKLLQLKQLDLSENRTLNGANMQMLPATIEFLSLTNCVQLKSRLLPQICNALPNLKELHLKGIFKICANFQQLISENCCSSLESLTISCGYGRNSGDEHIAMLPSLKKLIMHSQQTSLLLQTTLYSQLVMHKSQQLQHFELHAKNFLNSRIILQLSNLTALRTLILPNHKAIGDLEMEAFCGLQQLEELNIKRCSNVTENAVIRLIMGCPKLKVLHLEKCPKMTDRLLTDLIFKLRQKVTQRFLPIKLYVYGTNIYESALSRPDVAAKNIIDVSMEEPRDFEPCDNTTMNMFDVQVYELDSSESDDDDDDGNGQMVLVSNDDDSDDDNHFNFDDDTDDDDYFFANDVEIAQFLRR